MADIVLKDETGQDITYENIDTVSLPTTDGNTATFTLNTNTSHPDWNENDETSANYIANRPFYMGDYKSATTEIVPEISLSFTSSDMGYSFQTTPTSDMLEAWLSDWSEAVVVWDGTEYTCESQVFQGVKWAGNLSLMTSGVDSGEPFIMAMAEASTDLGLETDTIMIIAPYDTSDSVHTVSLSLVLEEQEIVTLDPKFIREVPWDKVTDKPFGVIPAGTVLYDGTISCATPFDSLYAAMIDEIDIIVGGAYTITIDGVSYECIAEISGNYVMMTYDGEDAFFMIANNFIDGKTTIILPIQGDYSFSITPTTDVIKKIDSIYLSSSLPEVTTEDDGKVLKVSGGAWTVANSLPTATSSDNGKFLRIVDGAPAWVELTDVSEVGA